MGSTEIDFESLLEHQSFLQALARGLVGDEQVAEDLVQETWLAALLRPPRHAGSLRGWLARILRHQAFNRARANRSRDEHEGQVARERSLATEEDLDSVFLLHGEIVEALRQQREPYRRVLYLRYYRELSPGEIAVEEGVPLATVKTQLRRGLTELREALDRRHGGQRALWAAPLAALSREASETAVAANVLLGGTIIMKAIAISVLVVGLVFLGWKLWPERSTSLPGVTPKELVAELPVAVESEPVVPVEPLPDVLADPVVSRSPVVLPESPNTTLRGQLVDEAGDPVSGATVTLREFHWPFASTRRSPSSDWEGPDPLSTDAEGRFTFRLSLDRAGRFIVRGEFDAPLEATSPPAYLQPGQDVDCGTIVVLPAGSLRIRVVDPQGLPVAERGWRVEIQRLAPLPGGGRPDPSCFAEEDAATGEIHLSSVPTGTVRIEARSERGSVATGQEVEVRAGVELLVELLYTGSDPRRRIVINLHDLNSELHFPYVPDASAVRAWLPGEKPRLAIRSGNPRQYLISDLDPGAYTVEIDHPTCVVWREEGVQPGADVEVVLRGSAAIRLEVTDGVTGDRIDDYQLLIGFPGLRVPDTLQTLRERSEPPPEGGLYEGFLPTVFEGSKNSHPILPEVFELVVRTPEHPDQRFPIEDLRPGETRELQAVLFPGTRVDGRVFLSDGETPAAEAVVMLTRGDVAGRIGGGGSFYRGGKTTWVRSVALHGKTDAEGRFHFDQLDRGTWTIRAAMDARLYIDETFQLDGESEYTLSMRLPTSGVVFGRVLLPGGEGRYTLRLSRVDDETYRPVQLEAGSSRTTRHIELDEEGRFRIEALPAGEFELSVTCWNTNRDGGQSGQSFGVEQRVLVRGGEETGCTIDASGGDLVAVHLRLTVDGSPSSSTGGVLRPADRRSRLRSASYREGEVRGGYRHLGLYETGEWELTIHGEGGSWVWHRPDPLLVRPGEELRIEVELQRVEGELRFLDQASGEVLAGREIFWDSRRSLSPDESRPQLVQTDEEGRARLHLPAGDLQLRLGYSAVNLSWPPADGPRDVSVKMLR